MGIKLLITVACQLAGEEISAHADVGDVVEVSKDDAALLTRMNRAMYLDRADDPTKGSLTASPEDRANIKRRAAAIDGERKQRAHAAEAASPAGMAAMVAAAVADAVKAAMSKPAGL